MITPTYEWQFAPQVEDADFTKIAKKAGLGPGRGPVDLVRQHDIGKQRALAELELPCFLVIKIDARKIRRQKIRRKLDPLKAAAHGPCKCL